MAWLINALVHGVNENGDGTIDATREVGGGGRPGSIDGNTSGRRARLTRPGQEVKTLQSDSVMLCRTVTAG